MLLSSLSQLWFVGKTIALQSAPGVAVGASNPQCVRGWLVVDGNQKQKQNS